MCVKMWNEQSAYYRMHIIEYLKNVCLNAQISVVIQVRDTKLGMQLAVHCTQLVGT